MRLTKRILDTVAVPERGAKTFLFDDALKGFGVVVHPTGRKVFIVQFGGRDRKRVTIGPYGVFTPDQARQEARRILGAVASGRDPVEERQIQRAVPSFATWVDSYLADVTLRKKTVADDRRFLGWLKERWPGRPLTKITTGDVQAAFEARRVQHGRISANRMLASIRACLQAAWRAGHILANPAARVRLLPENPPRQRVLTDDELQRVLAALATINDPAVDLAFKMLLATGARKSEVLTAKWEDIDLEAGLWRLPSPKSGRVQHVPLTREIVAALEQAPRLGPWVVSGRKPGAPMTNLNRAWAKIRAAAGVEGVTIHDLRRTFGLAVARTAGLHVASKLLRHATIRTTETIYAPLGIDELRKASERVARQRKATTKRKAAEQAAAEGGSDG